MRQRARRRIVAASDDGQRRVPVGSGTGSVSEVMRGAENAGADSTHVDNRKALEKLSRMRRQGTATKPRNHPSASSGQAPVVNLSNHVFVFSWRILVRVGP